MIPPSWSFIVWRMDIMGPFPRAVGGYRYLYVVIDKFTKWPEATLVDKINKKFITDNGTLFRSRAFQGYCEDVIIKICYASVVHPQCNGETKHGNAAILKGLKTYTFDCLKRCSAKWIDELLSVLWVNWTTPNHTTGETPFFLVYGPKVILPPPSRLPKALSMLWPMTKLHKTISGAKTSTSLMN
jgi:hypothetical protein